jgi:DNA-binding response OmpR family regulator
MDHTSFDETTIVNNAILTDVAAPWSSFPGRPRQGPEVLRYRGIAMNLVTGSVLIQGRPANLALQERELLAALMRRSGQIVSSAWLASQIRVSEDEVKTLANDLTSALAEAGATCLPRRVEGLGYVLWH